MEAKVFFGSTEAVTGAWTERRSPYDGRVVSKAPLCSAEDTHKALLIAKAAAKNAKASTLSQRCDWLHDVARRLREHKEELAKTITDEVGKPIAFSRVEVERCIETVTLAAETMRTMHGETVNTDAMPENDGLFRTRTGWGDRGDHPFQFPAQSCRA